MSFGMYVYCIMVLDYGFGFGGWLNRLSCRCNAVVLIVVVDYNYKTSVKLQCGECWIAW